MATAKASKAELDKAVAQFIPQWDARGTLHSRELFDRAVDQIINPSNVKTTSLTSDEINRLNDDMRKLYPILGDPSLNDYLPSGLKISKNQIPQGWDSLKVKSFLEDYFKQWINKFWNAWKRGYPSSKDKKESETPRDEALVRMVASDQHVDQNIARTWYSYHLLYESAENINGAFLEEYIYRSIQPYGWIWLRGECVTAADFCDSECKHFLQIKSRYNSENSSSKNFRVEHHVPMWFRVGRQKKDDGSAICNWPELVNLLQKATPLIPNAIMSEEGYEQFLDQAIRSASMQGRRIINS